MGSKLGLELLGQILDNKYLIEKELGEGGMGAVYLATHLGTSRSVALKVIHPQYMDNKEFVERFKREAKAAGHLRHPNIVNVTDFGIAKKSTGQFAYLVMEYLDGITLKDFIAKEKQISLKLALDILEQTALAIDEAHQAGIIHRDLKPANIWLQPNGRGEYIVKVLDFGLAKFTGSLPTNKEQNIDKLATLISASNLADTVIKDDSQVATLIADNNYNQKNTNIKNQTLLYNQQFEYVNNNEKTLAIDSTFQSEGFNPNRTNTFNYINEQTLAYNQSSQSIAIYGTDKNATFFYDQVNNNSKSISTNSHNNTSQFSTLVNSSDLLKIEMFGSLKTNKQKTASNTVDYQGETLTKLGSILGTPHYMSPEQFGGKDITASTDIYSLGVIAYEMFAGQKPFSGNMYQLLLKHSQSEIPSLRKKRKNISKSIQATIESAMAKVPSDRPISAMAFIERMKNNVELDTPLIKHAQHIYKANPKSFLALTVTIYLPILLSFLFVDLKNYLGNINLIFIFLSLLFATRVNTVATTIIFQHIENNKPNNYLSILKSLKEQLKNLFITWIKVPIRWFDIIKTGEFSFGRKSLYPILLILEHTEGMIGLKRSEKLLSNVSSSANILALYHYFNVIVSTIFMWYLQGQLSHLITGKSRNISSYLTICIFLLILCPLSILIQNSVYSLAENLLYKKAKGIIEKNTIKNTVTLKDVELSTKKTIAKNIGKALGLTLLKQLTVATVVLVAVAYSALLGDREQVRTATKEGNVAALEILIKNKANLNEAAVDSNLPLIVAIENNHPEVVKLMLNNGVSSDTKDRVETPALIIATRNGQKEIVNLLLEAKANVNLKDSNGNTALIEAVRNKQPEIVALLLKAKADVLINNYLGKNAITYANETNQEKLLSLLESKQ